MWNWLVLATVVWLATADSGNASADEPPGPLVTVVRVYDYTTTPDAMLKGAKDDVSRIYRQAGIDITWVEPSDARPAAGFAIRIAIRRRPVASSTHHPGQILGRSIGDTHDIGGSAFVFRDGIAAVARVRQQDVARLLGYAMAHEMGHLLLPYPAHSTGGIMRAAWDGDDLRHIANGTMLFTAAQTSLIRAKVADCCRR
jgi:hypothetical protein